MGLLDDIVGKTTSMVSGDKGEQPGFLGGIMEIVAGRESGGLGGLVQSFQEKGFGGIISSWIGTGENQSISASQLQQVLGSNTIQNLAAKFGIQPEDLSGKLAELLPGAIDRMTPDGTLPNGEG
jgi:uncharacterized protein YidB (DUF937 family)